MAAAGLLGPDLVPFCSALFHFFPSPPRQRLECDINVQSNVIAFYLNTSACMSIASSRSSRQSHLLALVHHDVHLNMIHHEYNPISHRCWELKIHNIFRLTEVYLTKFPDKTWPSLAVAWTWCDGASPISEFSESAPTNKED